MFRPSLKTISLAVMAVAYIFAGLNHFLKPKFYLPMMPPFLPAPMLLIYLSGLAEIGLGAALLVPRLSTLAAWGIIALLIAVFPANVYMLMTGGLGYNVPYSALVIRLPIQGLLILWAYWYT